MSRRAALRALALALALAQALSACGGDEGRVSQEPAGTETSGAPVAAAPAKTTPAGTEKAQAPAVPAAPPDRDGGGQAAPEDRPGGAGDEIPASTQALFTGRAGKISPPLIRVPPFIAVRVKLRSADGATYELSGSGKTLRAAGGSAEPVLFDGLRPGRRLSLTGTGGTVVIEASAEPGP